MYILYIDLSHEILDSKILLLYFLCVCCDSKIAYTAHHTPHTFLESGGAGCLMMGGGGLHPSHPSTSNLPPCQRAKKYCVLYFVF